MVGSLRALALVYLYTSSKCAFETAVRMQEMNYLTIRFFSPFWSKTLNRCDIFTCIHYDIIDSRSSITAQSNTMMMNIQRNQSFEMATFDIFSFRLKHAFTPLKSVVIPLKNGGATNPVSHSFIIS